MLPARWARFSPSRLAPKKLLFVLTRGNPDEGNFADIFPRYDRFMKWMGFTESHLIRVCGIGPAGSELLSERAPMQAEEAARALLS